MAANLKPGTERPAWLAALDGLYLPPWLAALDGLCLACADAEFYGVRKSHADCEHGDCQCRYVIPNVWPAGTWGA